MEAVGNRTRRMEDVNGEESSMQRAAERSRQRVRRECDVR